MVKKPYQNWCQSGSFGGRRNQKPSFDIASKTCWKTAINVGMPLLFWACCISTAAAHGIHLSAHAHGDSIHGSAHFNDDTPVRGAKVLALDSTGEKIAETETDQQGEFTVKAKYRCDHRLLLDTGDGHGAEYLVTAAQLSPDLPAREGVAVTTSAAPLSSATHQHTHAAGGDLEALHDEVRQLREQLTQYERRVRLRDVLGGIGYIVGIFGVAYYVLARKRGARG